jgi:hypothetical protein
MTDRPQDVPVEDYGGDAPEARPAPTIDAPDIETAAPRSLPASREILEDAPVQGYGGEEPTTAGGEP